MRLSSLWKRATLFVHWGGLTLFFTLSIMLVITGLVNFLLTKQHMLQ